MAPLGPPLEPIAAPLSGGDSVVSHGSLMNPTAGSAGKLVVWALGAGLVAGVASWLIGELVRETFKPPLQTQVMMGQVIKKAKFEDQSAADFRNATLAFTILGGLMGAALGMAGGLAGKSPAAGPIAAAVGVLVGSLFAAGASLGFLPLYFRALDVSQEALSHDLVLPLVVHAGIWAACGLAGGVAFGFGLRAGATHIAKCGIGGLIGAALGAAIYELIGAMVFPAAVTTRPLSLSWSTRLMARLLVAILAAVMAAVFVSSAGGSANSDPGGPIRTP
jgi:hypothetical protein